jgi:DNA-binding CsgD family transcriptional regulator
MSPSSNPGRATIISSREREVLQLVVSGLPMKSVARRLGITARTVAFHKYRAMRLLGLRGNADLVDYAIQTGLLGGKTFAAPFNAHDATLAVPGD